MQARDYKMITEKDFTKIDYKKYPSLMGNVLNSAICFPVDN
jgi:hypothetical protein